MPSYEWMGGRWHQWIMVGMGGHVCHALPHITMPCHAWPCNIMETGIGWALQQSGSTSGAAIKCACHKIQNISKQWHVSEMIFQ